MRAIPLKCQTGLVVLAFMTFAASGTAFAQSPSADHSAVVRALSNPRPLDLNSLSAIAVAESRQANPRTSDSLLDGALIGAGVAIAGGLFLCTRTEPWENCRDDVGPIVRIGAIGAGVGIAVDALIRGDRTPDDPTRGTRRLWPMPLIGRGIRGAALSVGF